MKSNFKITTHPSYAALRAGYCQVSRILALNCRRSIEKDEQTRKTCLDRGMREKELLGVSGFKDQRKPSFDFQFSRSSSIRAKRIGSFRRLDSSLLHSSDVVFPVQRLPDSLSERNKLVKGSTINYSLRLYLPL